jgi:NADP-dependent 3-hydroxy acid dehydrogenase YdfG
VLLDEGAKVAITGRTESRLAEAAAALQPADRVLARAADITDPQQVQKLVEEVAARFGPVDILVNNAGVNIKERTFRELTPRTWRELMAGNLDGAFHCMQAVVPAMREHGDGLIININSLSGLRANPLGGIAYIAAKFGLRGLAMGVAAEEKASNLRITSIYPGEVNTPILEQRPTPVSDERKQAMLQPEDVAAAVLLVVTLPARATIPELIITPTNATYL